MCIQITQSFQLDNAERGFYLCHPIVPTQDIGSVCALSLGFQDNLAVIAYHLSRFSNSGIVGNKHPTFSGHDCFGLREGKNPAIAECTNKLPLVTSTRRLGAILDNFKLMLAREIHNRLHIGRMSEEMHGNDGSR